MRVTRIDSQTSLTNEPSEAEIQEAHETWNRLVAAERQEEEDLCSRRYCACWQAHPDNPSFVPGHDHGACDCWCDLCWRARSAYEQAVRQTEQDGMCFCRQFWSEGACAAGFCRCQCERCLASQAAFEYEEEKRLIETRRVYWQAEADKPRMEYPYGHDQWCECDSCGICQIK
jgi:hypothetical protein